MDTDPSFCACLHCPSKAGCIVSFLANCCVCLPCSELYRTLSTACSDARGILALHPSTNPRIGIRDHVWLLMRIVNVASIWTPKEGYNRRLALIYTIRQWDGYKPFFGVHDRCRSR